MAERTFCIGSATVARFLERKVGNMLGARGLQGMARGRAFEETYFNMMEVWRLGRFVSPQTTVSPAKYFDRLLVASRLEP